ncbi:MAG TPA: hypothetical protein VFZ16_22190 [Hyphomicrobiaceae bacterium]|nr:hypothetical protein [Hyphomicrobiaceae bacterium]
MFDYIDGSGKRRRKVFKTKRAAEDYGATVRVDLALTGTCPSTT